MEEGSNLTNMKQTESSKNKILFVGGLLGLLSGLIAAYLLLQRSEQNEKDLSISPGDGVKSRFRSPRCIKIDF